MVINFITVQGVRGSKRPKNYVHTKSIAPKYSFHLLFTTLSIMLGNIRGNKQFNFDKMAQNAKIRNTMFD